MKSARLKDLINNKDTSISFEEYRLRYAAERFLMRVTESQFKDKLILKGGFLLGVIYDIEQRTTKDLDALLTGITADKNGVEAMLSEIIRIDLKDDITFEITDLSKSSNGRIYDGFRAKVKMKFTGENTYIQFDLDLGVGDVVTPSPQYPYCSMKRKMKPSLFHFIHILWKLFLQKKPKLSFHLVSLTLV